MTRLRPFVPLALFWLICLWLFAQTDRWDFRYQRFSQHGDAIYCQEGRVDVAFLGNSRSKLAIDAALVSRYLEERGEPAVVFDLARCWRSQENLFVIARDFLERHEVGTLAIEYNPAPERPRSHPFTPVNARFVDLVENALCDTHYALPRRLSWILKWSLDRAVFHSETFVTGRRRQFPPTTPARTTDCTMRPTLSVQEEIQERQAARGDYWKTEIQKWDLDRSHEVKLAHFTRRVIELAQARGVRVVLVHHPEIYYGPLSQETAEAMRSRFGVEFITPPPELLGRLFNPAKFADCTHLTPEGRREYSEWLLPKLLK